jgi:hypothetical protein
MCRTELNTRVNQFKQNFDIGNPFSKADLMTNYNKEFHMKNNDSVRINK